MRAVRVKDGAVCVVDAALPGGDGVRVHVRSAGICGSDLHMLAGGFPIESTLGHELAGVLDDGTPVAVEPVAPCGECDGCRRGDYNLCRLGPACVFGVGRDGGMADAIRVPERALVPLPVGLRPEDACLVEPLAVAVHGLRRAGVTPGARVCVIGAGAIGLCAAAVARRAGSEVGLVARHDAQREAGARLGCREASGEYDLVVDAAGNEAALADAVERARPGATLLLVASYWSGLVLPGFAVAMKEVTVVPASMYARSAAGRDIDQAAALLGSWPELASILITHRMPLDAAADAFRIAADRASGAIKVVLEPGLTG